MLGQRSNCALVISSTYGPSYQHVDAQALDAGLTLVLDGKVQTRRRRRPACGCCRADLLCLAAMPCAAALVDVALAVAGSRGLAVAGVSVCRLLLRIESLHDPTSEHESPLMTTCTQVDACRKRIPLDYSMLTRLLRSLPKQVARLQSMRL